MNNLSTYEWLSWYVPGRRGSGPVRTSRIVEYREESIALGTVLSTAAELKGCGNNNLELPAIFEALGRWMIRCQSSWHPLLSSVIKLH